MWIPSYCQEWNVYSQLTSRVMLLNSLVGALFWQGIPFGWRPVHDAQMNYHIATYMVNCSFYQIVCICCTTLILMHEGGMLHITCMHNRVLYTVSCFNHVSASPYLSHFLPPPQAIHLLHKVIQTTLKSLLLLQLESVTSSPSSLMASTPDQPHKSMHNRLSAYNRKAFNMVCHTNATCMYVT